MRVPKHSIRARTLAAKTLRSHCDVGRDSCNSLSGITRVSLVGDDWIILSRLRHIIEKSSDFAVVAASADRALLAVEYYKPAAVILDARPPGRVGVELIRDVTATSRAKVIVFTAAQERRTVSILLDEIEAIVFQERPALLMSCLRRVLAGRPWIPQQIKSVGPVADANPLSPREQEVAKCAALGARNKEIAWELGISEGTVKLHLVRAFRKLGVGSRVELTLALHRMISEALVYITFVSLTFV